MYDKILRPVYDRKKIQKVKIGLGHGFAWFSMFFSMATLFWGAAEIVLNFDVKIMDVFASLMILMNASSNAGAKAGAGADLGEA
jgi:hypothetical protein